MTGHEPGDGSEHQRLRESLGAHALGGLPDPEAAEVERHLASCAACRAELAGLRPAVDALAELRALRADDPAPARPPAALEHRVLSAVDDDRDDDQDDDRDDVRRRRRRWSSAPVRTAAALALVVGLGAGVGIGGGFGGTDRPERPAVPVEAVPVSVATPGVRVTAGVVPHTWGIEVKLHASGFRRGGDYRVTVVGRDGVRHGAGGFVGTGSREMDCNLNATVLRDDAARVEVRDARGRVVVTSDLT